MMIFLRSENGRANKLKVNGFILPTKFTQKPNFLTSIPLYSRTLGVKVLHLKHNQTLPFKTGFFVQVHYNIENIPGFDD